MRMRGCSSVVVAAQLVERGDGAIARAIGVVDRGPVDRLAAFPHGKLLGNAERLAVADDHADDVVVRRHPARHERVHAHARQADLALGAVRVLEGKGGQLFFMGAPAHLSRGRPLFAEALDAPGVDELVHLFGLIGDLRVALAAMNDLDAELVGQVVELLRLGVVRDLLRLSAAELLVRQGLPSDVQKRLLGEMADQARVRPVFEHRRRPRLAPPGDHPPQVHVPPVECPLGRVLVVRPAVGVPELHRRVDIQHAPVVAPLDDFAAIDVPRQVDEEIPGRDVLAQQRAQILRRHALPDEGHALLDPGLQSRLVWLKVHDGDALGIDADVLAAKWAACTAPRPQNRQTRFDSEMPASVSPPSRDDQSDQSEARSATY